MLKLRPRLTYANVVSTLCLFIVLGGSAVAATVITGKNVKDSSLTGTDVKNSSLTTRDVKNGSLLAGDFKAGQLTGGAQGPAGPQGLQGVKGDKGDRGPSNAYASDNRPQADGAKSTSINLPAGKYVVHGKGYAFEVGLASPKWFGCDLDGGPADDFSFQTMAPSGSPASYSSVDVLDTVQLSAPTTLTVTCTPQDATIGVLNVELAAIQVESVN